MNTSLDSKDSNLILILQGSIGMSIITLCEIKTINYDGLPSAFDRKYYFAAKYEMLDNQPCLCPQVFTVTPFYLLLGPHAQPFEEFFIFLSKPMYNINFID